MFSLFSTDYRKEERALWNGFLYDHLRTMGEYRGIVLAFREGRIQLPGVEGIIHHYLSETVPEFLEEARKRADSGLVLTVERCLQKVRKEIYPLQVV